MSKPIQVGGPAFPGFQHTEGRGPYRKGPSDEWEYHAPGMTLRDWFAGQALSGILASPLLVDDIPEDAPLGPVVTKAAYEYADGMIKAREAQP